MLYNNTNNKLGINTASDFESVLKIQRNLSDKTVKIYLRCFKRFMDFLNDKVITVRLIETYLTGTKDKRNNLAMLKVLCPDLVEGFRFPKVKVRIKILPSKGDMKAFCDALPSDMYRLHFLLLVTSGLRVEEPMKGEINRSNRMILPKEHDGKTKGTWVSFYNSEAEELLNRTNFKQVSTDTLSHVFKKTRPST